MDQDLFTNGSLALDRRCLDLRSRAEKASACVKYAEKKRP